LSKVRLATAADVPLDSLHRVDTDELAICLVRTGDGNFYCIQDQCTHENASLSDGYLTGTEVECPLHSSSFDVITGSVSGLPAQIPLRTFPVDIEDGDVFAEIETS